jgi:Na+-translocating ferredoxin:NAD+ oxidoreductase RNF subunit RnfB
VAVDPKVEAVTAALPGANCGGCGCVGCNEYAIAAVEGKLPPDKCTVGGVSCAAALAKILGVELKPTWPYRPAVHCGATTGERLGRQEYRGERTCISANLIAGVQGCTYGCLGLGDCEAACAFDAIHVVRGLASVDYTRCTGCGACERACPRHIISMVPFKADRMLVVACSNKDFGKDVRAVCKVGCIGCRACARANSLFEVQDNLSVIDYDQYDPDKMDALKLAVEKCPMKRLVLVGRPTEEGLKAVADKKVPEVVQADFKTTVDQTEWHG